MAKGLKSKSGLKILPISNIFSIKATRFGLVVVYIDCIFNILAIMNKFAVAFLPLLTAAYILTDEFSGSEKSVKDYHVNQLDGPYVSYNGNQVFVKYILNDHGNKLVKKDSMPVSEKANLSLNVLTDEEGKTFTVKLKKELENEKTEFSKVSKQFVVSDIEGNFGAFRKLLQGNNVIDASYNWTFGNGHLVLTGDFVDRGNQQTEVLWLIYSLEEKAKAAGGYVHYILGNHEIMNMSGDLRYLHAKYVEHAILLNENITALYGDNTELGRWLRTKNVIEKVGDVLFCHGGISAAVNRMDLSISKISKLVRPYYADSTYQYNTPEADTLYSDAGPFWYRGYYNGVVKASMMQVDSTLSAYRVKHIATGHTVIADTISALYNGKVLNTDVHHAKGHTEALLIEGGNFFRVTVAGEKIQIMKK